MGTFFQHLTRRDFIRYLSVGSISIPVLMKGLAENLMAQEPITQQPIIWIQGQNSGIHSAGIWNLPEFSGFLEKFFKIVPQSKIDGDFIPLDDSDAAASHILILEGQFTNDPNDPLNSLIKDLIVVSRGVILLGNEAAYGKHAPEGFMDPEGDLLHHVETPFFKLPGAPVHARHILGMLNHLVLYGLPELDAYRRPSVFYSTLICNRCEYRSDFEAGRFVRYHGEREGCLYLMGCKGPVTKNSCPIEKWNGTSNWCVGAGSPCTGCSEPEYPDHHGLGMFGQLSSNDASINSFFVRHLETIAKGTAVLTVAGIATHAISKRTSSPLKGKRLSILEDEDE
ncbi:MAG: hypothetical protein HN580_06020 [Deltaproteobacteria bacterium]|jgi:Ni,Fe-hydrogenase I small subunit|nr:hypothetical protein [Deltaproteobacteria bacterium]MBT4638625.1 hypothetical protein [Deltaproteobacteria bacterium]MBT6503512.1 hypothetical protein [Deltaproteobacteria bacterium]MBT6611612.1 hypothetical protein [Deltaproteobacteria bacterium]MBT7152267.1 hypothetical protein [Deltaproteobacteria bacterium]